MAAELNTPRHAYYQRVNNVRLPRRAESRTWIDTGGAALPVVLEVAPEPEREPPDEPVAT